MKTRTRFGIALLLWLSTIPAALADLPEGIEKIRHIVVIYLENRSFDHLYGLFPGANGLPNAGLAALQTDRDGAPYAMLPPVMLITPGKPPEVDARFPKSLPNRPFDIGDYVPAHQNTGDLVHRFYQNQMQINGGRNDRFAAISDAGGLSMGYYDGHNLPLWKYAAQYTLADNFYQAAFGGSMLNHFWLICACTPRYPDAPAELRATLDDSGKLVKDGVLTPDGYVANTIQPYYMPHKPGTAKLKALPPQTLPTIGDRLTEKNIDWAWYSGGWNDALSGWSAPTFQFHHQPFAYFRNYADGSENKARHLKDESDFLAAIESGALPPVSFYKPLGLHNEHPGYADVMTGEKHVADIIARIERSPMWPTTAIIVTYDENGGFWDHAAPPQGDRWGPGTRVPAIIISPYAKRGHVDHTLYDTTSILKFIETRHGLNPLGERDANANGLTGAFAFD
ncbi:MAG: alkaline phosphatase family protein [Sulfuricellaceae bacterium]